jgi:hypothetical protein
VSTATVSVGKCWGCGRLRIPKPWTPETLPLLDSERRLRFHEYLCDNDDCPANAIAGVKPHHARQQEQT